jgi:hypothetical protein
VANAVNACGPSATLETILAEIINTANTNHYDKAIDSIYNSSRIGGSLTHHIVDGRHDILGAFEAAKDAYPDDRLSQEILGTANHLYKDLFSKMGLPLSSMPPEQYREFSKWVSDVSGVSKRWIADMMQVNGVELFAATISATAVLFGLKHLDAMQLIEMGASLGIGGIVAGNPLSLICGTLSLVLAWRIKKSGQNWSEAILVFGRGLAATGAAMAVGSMLLGFASAGIIQAVIATAIIAMTGLTVRRFMGRNQPAPEKVEPLSPEIIRNACMKNLPSGERNSNSIVAEYFDKDFADEYSRWNSDDIIAKAFGPEFAAKYRSA